MVDHTTRSLIRAILQEENETRLKQEDAMIKRTLDAVLVMLGIDPKDDDLSGELKELRADFAHNRRWRKSVERVEKVGTAAAVSTLVAGVLGALWLGVAASVTKPIQAIFGKG